jgi:hypothetical protein
LTQPVELPNAQAEKQHRGYRSENQSAPGPCATWHRVGT